MRYETHMQSKKAAQGNFNYENLNQVIIGSHYSGFL
jgi:hypothetical protein